VKFSGEKTVRRRVAAVAACLMVAALALTGCARAADPTATGVAVRMQVSAGLQRFYDQKLQWESCPGQWAIDSGVAKTAAQAAEVVAGFQCAWLTVPLNYQNPGGPTIRLAMNRLRAADPAARIGPLLTNPGGPGGSGVGFGFGAKSYFTAQVRARYDIVGMDPRGVGLSSPVNCMLTVQEQAETNLLTAAKDVAQACERSAGTLIPHVGTDSAARDLDIARAVLGEAKLDYYGVSYGTLLGLTYAKLFPHNVGRMVLDSVDSPTSENNPVTQATGFETTFMFMVSSCVNRGGCPMGATQSAAVANYDALISQLQSSPLPDPSGGTLTGDDVTGIVSHALYTERAWPALWTILGALINGSRDLTNVGALAAALGGQTGGDQSFPAIFCLTIPQGQRTVAAAQQAGRLALAAAPRFGGFVESARDTCALWPVSSPADAGQPISAPGTPTILLVNNVYDPATPLVWAQQVHADLADSVLVTNVAGGHGFYGLGACTNGVVDNFLISFSKPVAGTTCHDRNPLVASPTVAVTG
jgi:pimeloyl-ACP methyl ester carboxylesterase